MKTKSLVLALFLGVALLVGCGNNGTTNDTTNKGATTEEKENTN